MVIITVNTAQSSEIGEWEVASRGEKIDWAIAQYYKY